MTTPFKAAIFDMDGTLLDSMPAWRSLGKRFLKERNLPVPAEIQDDRQITCFRACEVISSTYDVGMNARELFIYVLRYLTELYETGVQPRPGAPEYLARLQDTGVACCVATATPIIYARPALVRHNLIDGLRFALGGDEMPIGKDDPAYFEQVAARLGFEPQECVVFEDALYAIRSAKQAGCTVWAIADDFAIPDRDEILSLADRFVWSFEELVGDKLISE